MNKEKEVISKRQLRDIMICNIWPTAINYGSGILARQVGRDMWISSIISIFVALPFVAIAVHIGRNFPNKTIVEYSKDLLGSVLGKVLGLILTIYFFLGACSSVIMYIHHLSDFLLPQTPFVVMTVMHVLVICYLVWKGDEVIGRTAIVAFSMAIIFYFLVIMASLPEIDIDRITPFFDSGVVPVFQASLKATSTFMGLPQIVLTMLLPMVNDQKNAFRAAASGLFIGGFLLTLYFIAELMVMGPQVVALMRIASMDFVRSIEITKYLHRFESFMVGLWYWSIMIQAGILTSCALRAFMQTTSIKKKNPFIIIVLGLMMVIVTYYIGHDRVLFLNLREYVWQYLALPIQFGVPLLLFLALGLKKTLTSAKK